MKIVAFTVLPDTPPKLKHLEDLAYNFYFSWNPDVEDLFRRLGEDTWAACNRNPVSMLSLVPLERLEEAANDPSYLAELSSIYDRYRNYMEETTWFERQHGTREQPVYAYFSAEFGVHECLPIYSGGLGVLAGDHIKSASDLGVPLVGVGLFYRQGYFHQYLNADGTQQESYVDNDWYSMAVTLEKDADGNPLRGAIELAGEEVFYHIWRIAVGRVSVYLLDANLPENSEAQRDITKILYDPDREVRIRQELLLGIGGLRALDLLGLAPKVFHVNEGHSAFLLLERVQQLMQQQQLSFDEARHLVWSTTVFTTHTPVPAGNERFSSALIYQYCDVYRQPLGLDWNTFMSLGRENPADQEEEFCLTVLALKLSAFANGVSRLHGSVSRQMWQQLYPEVNQNEIPIGHITNGVHARSWMSTSISNLFLRYGGPSNVSELAPLTMWQHVERIPDNVLWDIHEHNRQLLVDYVRQRLRLQMTARGASASDLNQIKEVLDPRALTIGFARRFATYKRGYLLFRNVDRLRSLLCNPERPVQIIIAGKAHPADQNGKTIIRNIFQIATQPEFRRHIVFIEDYDMEVARHMVQGVDVWLNNPRRPLEASGTSGMKAAINGVLNLSVLDGWWDEAFTPEVGWAIGHGEEMPDIDAQDNIEGDLLYRTLEREIMPTFYDRGDHLVPRNWVAMMKATMARCGSGFNSHRMVRDYIDRYYLPAEDLCDRLRRNSFAGTKALAEWRAGIADRWPSIEIISVESVNREVILKGTELEIVAAIRLLSVKQVNVIVECCHGSLDLTGNITAPKRTRMSLLDVTDDVTRFRATIPCSVGGRYGYTVRILPGYADLAVEFLPGLIKWWD